MDSSYSEDETIGPFIIGETLGIGATAKVKLAVHKKTGQYVAIKIINKSLLTIKPELKRKIEREIAVMKLIKHKHVVQLYDVLQDKKYLYLILEYVEGGELFEYLVQKGRLSNREAFHFFRQIINAIEYCHSVLICHRDLKPENLLLDKHKNVKIGDFGMASLMDKDKQCETSCGSPHYASPEVVKGEKYNGEEADIWSCGVILYALLTGSLPFDDDNIGVLLQKVKHGEFILPDFLSNEEQDLISKMLCVDPRNRITIAGIKQHPWWKHMKILRKKHALTRAGSVGNFESSSDLFSPVSPPTPGDDFIGSTEYQSWQPPQQANQTSPSKEIPVNKEEQKLKEIEEEDELLQEDVEEEEEDEEELVEASPNTNNSSFSSTEKAMPYEPLTKDELDENIIQSIRGMGWLDEEKLKDAISSPSKTIESVLYRLLVKQKTGSPSAGGGIIQSSSQPIAINKSGVSTTAVSVSPANPIQNAVSYAVLKQKFDELHKKQLSGSLEKESPTENHSKKWFSFWKKSKKQAQVVSTFGILSTKSQNEIISELSRSFQVLHILYERISDTVIRAKFSYQDSLVEFDITMSSLPQQGGFLLNFARVSGHPLAARILFDVLQQELNL